MAKTFAKFFIKTCTRLLVTIVAIIRILLFTFHLEAKYVKMESTQKTELGAPGLQKVNEQVNGQSQRSTVRSTVMMLAR